MKLFFTLALGYTSFLASQSLVLATPAPFTSVHPLKINSSSIATTTPNVSFVPPPPPSSGRPGGRVRGGAKRGTCPNVKPELTALVPFTEEASITDVWGLTTEARPTLLFYVPYSQKDQYPTEFILQDQQSNPIYQKAIALPNRPGVISISLPADAPALALDQEYRWFLTIYCDPEKQSPPIYVEGVIKRVVLNAETTQQLKTASVLEKFAIYAKNGIWHEASVTLAQLRQQNPQDQAIETQWKNLLASIRLDDIAPQPIITSKPE